MNFTDILEAMRLGGAAMPAFERLFQLVLPLFSDDDQDSLKALYAKARDEGDDADADLQAAIRERRGE